jgi:hypothetical protein
MTERPSLPLHVDSTMMTCFRSCPRKYFLEFVMGYRPPGLSIDLHAGGCFAQAIETTYREIYEKGASLQEALLKAHAAFLLSWGDFQIPDYKRTSKTLDRVWQAVEEYFQNWPSQTDHIKPYIAADGKATFEYTFAIPLEPTHPIVDDGVSFPCHPSGDPFLYAGRLDMLGELNGRPIGRDEKTTGRSFSSTWSETWDLRSQFIGYTWAMREGGIPDVDTIAVRGICILKESIKFAEAIKTYPDFMRERWKEQLRRDLWRLRRAWNEGYFDYNLGDSCTNYGNCVFMTPCSVPEDQQASWLSQYETRHWNPLNKNPAGDLP